MSLATIRLDLRGVERPLNYVKTYGTLDELSAGQVLKVLVDDDQTVHGIPQNLQDEGHVILASEPAAPGHRIVIRKT